MAAQTRIYTLGGFRAINPQGEPIFFRTRKTAMLLAYLSTCLDRDVHRDDLAATFWPESEDFYARGSLSVCLTALRKELDPGGGGAQRAIVSDNRTVRLNSEFVWSDEYEFQRLVKKAHLNVVTDERVDALLKALDLYEGPFLANETEFWAGDRRERLEARFHEALCEALDLAQNQDDVRTLLSHAGRATMWQPNRPDLEQRVNIARERLGLSASVKMGTGERPVPSKRQFDRSEDSEATRGEILGGAVPLTSRYYIDREADGSLRDCVNSQDGIILIKGSRQSGKSSLLARGIQLANTNGARVLLTDFQSMDADCTESTYSFYLWLMSVLLDQLGRTEKAKSFWDDQVPASMNFERFIRFHVLSEQESCFWAMDEVDRLFTWDQRSDFFSLVRSWHNKRALEPNGPWHRMMVAISYATEAHLFIPNLNESPFNVGIPIELDDFTLDQTNELNRRYGGPVRNQIVMNEMYSLISGHPFLTRCVFEEMSRGVPWAVIRKAALSDNGPFAEHLRFIGRTLGMDSTLDDEIKSLFAKRPALSAGNFYKLRSAGIVKGRSANTAELRCDLYRQFFKNRLKSIA